MMGKEEEVGERVERRNKKRGFGHSKVALTGSRGRQMHCTQLIERTVNVQVHNSSSLLNACNVAGVS